MSDLNDQLRSYIDGLENPVSVHETMSRKAKRTYKVPAAILAGAAIVLVPAMVLIGIRWWPVGDDIGATTAAPIITPITTTSQPPDLTTTAVSPIAQIEIPDVVGLSEAEARQILSDLGLRLSVTETYVQRSDIGLIRSQWPEPGEVAAHDAVVNVGVAVAATCDSRDDTLDQPAEGDMSVTILVECGPDYLYPDINTPIARTVPVRTNTIEATLNALLPGLSDEEIATGLSSVFRAETATALNTVHLDGGALVVDFNDAILIGSFSTSTGGLFFMAELQANLFQFPEVDSIEFRLNGSCEAFFNWLQGSCQIQTRAVWDATVATWEAERALQAEPGEELTPGDVVGKTFTMGEGADSRRILQLVDGRQVDSGFDEMRSWALDDPRPIPATAESTTANWVSHVTGLNTEMLWLASSSEPYDTVPSVYEVRATLEIPWDEMMPTITSDPFVMNGAQECTRNGEDDSTMVVVTRIEPADFDITGGTIPVRAWQIDVDEAVFAEIPVDGIECFYERG